MARVSIPYRNVINNLATLTGMKPIVVSIPYRNVINFRFGGKVTFPPLMFQSLIGT